MLKLYLAFLFLQAVKRLRMLHLFPYHWHSREFIIKKNGKLIKVLCFIVVYVYILITLLKFTFLPFCLSLVHTTPEKSESTTITGHFRLVFEEDWVKEIT